jgi:hypothetical protein
LHEIWQVPAKQDGVPPIELQAFPHLPQLATDPIVFVSQPFTMLPSQFPKPALQAMAQSPLEHEGVPVVDSQ